MPKSPSCVSILNLNELLVQKSQTASRQGVNINAHLRSPAIERLQNPAGLGKSPPYGTLRYRVTNAFPKSELYGLTSQIRRCAVPIAANIAEGCGKRGNGEFQRFLNIAAGSASELEYHFLLARDLGYLNETDYPLLSANVVEVKRMLASLARKVEEDRLAS
jgi:four helix bundle protein